MPPKKKTKVQESRPFEKLDENLIRNVLERSAGDGRRELDDQRTISKVFARAGKPLARRWIAVAPRGSNAAGLPAHVKRTLYEALTEFLYFRRANPTGPGFEIRLPDNEPRGTGWAVIGGGQFRGLQLSDEYRWNGLRIVTPELDVVYGEGSRYSVVMKEGLTTIGERAFAGCTGLTSVTFPEGLTTIGRYAFAYCTGLTSLIFPAGLTNIGEKAFYKCTGLTSMTFPAGLTTIGGWAFHGCTGLTSLTFPAGLTTIGEGAFVRCTGLTSLVLPSTVKTIERAAFWRCTGLTSLTFPEGLTDIGEGAFRECTGLTSVTLPKNCFVHRNAFPAGCKIERTTPAGGVDMGVTELYGNLRF